MSNAHQSLHDLVKLSQSLSKFVEDNEKISLPLFTAKLTTAQQNYPEDYTIGMMSTVVGRMANSDKLFISRAEIKDLYEKFYSRNNKFANVFEEELGRPANISQTTAQSVEDNHFDPMQEAIDTLIDPVLASSLDQLFGGNKVKNYSERSAKMALNACNNKFKELGFSVQSEVLCSKNNVFICSVAFETPRGSTSVFVPVETIDNQVYSPSVFVGNTGSEEISKEAIVAYLTSKAGEKLSLRAEEILEAAIIAKGADEEISDVDIAVTKLNAQKESTVDYLAPQVLGVEIKSENPNLMLNLPVSEDPEISSIARTFESELGFANFKFGSVLIRRGHDLISNELEKCGVNTYSIAVHDSNDDSIIYSVAVNGGSVAFKVPLKIENKNILPPSIVLCNGSVKSFDKTSIANLLHEEGFDRVASLSASPLYGLKASELVNIVRTAVSEENYIKAEDALNILANSDDEKAYSVALNVFKQSLAKQEIASEEVNKCSMIVRTKHSQYDMCGHTGLPLHKTYQDKNGHCQPIYRKGMDESYEGATFMNSKIYL